MTEAFQTAEEVRTCKKLVGSINYLRPEIKNLQVITCFTTIFAKWRIIDEGLLLQLFPRQGKKDVWFEGRWVNDRYIPGRGEQKTAAAFPPSFEKEIQSAASKVWFSTVRMDYVPELLSYVLLFEGLFDINCTAQGEVIDKFLEYLDSTLDPH